MAPGTGSPPDLIDAVVLGGHQAGDGNPDSQKAPEMSVDSIQCHEGTTGRRSPRLECYPGGAPFRTQNKLELLNNKGKCVMAVPGASIPVTFDKTYAMASRNHAPAVAHADRRATRLDAGRDGRDALLLRADHDSRRVPPEFRGCRRAGRRSAGDFRARRHALRLAFRSLWPRPRADVVHPRVLGLHRLHRYLAHAWANWFSGARSWASGWAASGPRDRCWWPRRGRRSIAAKPSA